MLKHGKQTKEAKRWKVKGSDHIGRERSDRLFVSLKLYLTICFALFKLIVRYRLASYLKLLGLGARAYASSVFAGDEQKADFVGYIFEKYLLKEMTRRNFTLSKGDIGLLSGISKFIVYRHDIEESKKS